MNAAEEMWENFINHLHTIQPIGKPDKETNEFPKHVNLIGSVASYKKIFLDANLKNDVT